MLTMKEILLYAVTAAVSFITIALNMIPTLAFGYDLGTDMILAYIFIYDIFLLIMVIIKSGLVKRYYDPKHIRFAGKMLGAAETVYVMIVISFLMSMPRAAVFFYNAAREPLRALKNALFFTWIYDYYVPHYGAYEPNNMAFAWILSFTIATTVLMYFAVTRFYNMKKMAAFLERRPEKKQGQEKTADEAKKEKLPKLLEESAEDELIPDEEDFHMHLRQISESPLPQSKPQRECPLCGSMNPAENEQCSFCGGELTEGKDGHDV